MTVFQKIFDTPTFPDDPELEFRLALILHTSTLLAVTLPFFLLVSLLIPSTHSATLFSIFVEWLAVLLIRQWAMRSRDIRPGVFLVAGGLIAALLETVLTGAVMPLGAILFVTWIIMASLLFNAQVVYPLILGLIGLTAAILFLEQYGLWTASIIQPIETIWIKVFIQTFLVISIIYDSHRIIRRIFLTSQRTAEENRKAEQALLVLTEREKVGRELHDGLGQILGSITLQANIARVLLGNGQNEDALAAISRIEVASAEASQDVRRHILGLVNDGQKPEQDLASGLMAVRDLAQSRYSVPVQLSLPKVVGGVNLFPYQTDQLLKIAQEAITNAAKHSRSHVITVTLQLLGDQLQVLVADTGIGFDPAVPAPDGHVGLQMMRQRVAQLNGTLEVRSGNGSGTQVLITIPHNNPKDTQTAEDKPLRVLIADDHPMYLEGLSQALSLHGFLVVGTARDGAEAVEKALLLKPDLILLDNNMPVLGGNEAVRTIKQKLPCTRVFILTVSTTDEHLYHAIMNGASGYLLKTINDEELVSILKSSPTKDPYIDPTIAPRAVTALRRSAGLSEFVPQESELTAQQNRILMMVRQGKIYKEIAEELGLSTPTIKYHISQILRRLNVRTREEALELLRAREDEPETLQLFE